MIFKEFFLWQVGRAQHLPSPQKQPQVTQTLHLGISSSSLPKPGMQPSQPQQLVLDHEEGQQHGGILLSQLSSKPQAPAASAQPIGQKAQQEATVTEPVQSSREGQKLPHSSHDQQQVELSLQHNRQSNALPERQVCICDLDIELHAYDVSNFLAWSSFWHQPILSQYMMLLNAQNSVREGVIFLLESI